MTNVVGQSFAPHNTSRNGVDDGHACIVVSHWEEEVPWGSEDGVRRYYLEDGMGQEI